MGTNGGRQNIDLVIHPLRTAAAHDPLYMVVFQDIGGIVGSDGREAPADDHDLESGQLRQIEIELRPPRSGCRPLPRSSNRPTRS